MRTSFTPEEVDRIENDAYNFGVSIGAHQERERIIMALKNFADDKMDANVLEAIDFIKHLSSAR